MNADIAAAFGEKCTTSEIRASVVTSARARALKIAALLLFVGGCIGNPQPISLANRPTLAPDDALQFEYREHSYTIKSVRVSADSVSGIDWRYPGDPRITFPIASLSKIQLHRAGETGGGEIVRAVFIAVVGAWVTLLVVFRIACRGSCD
jgi:hypothetical protein